MHKLPNTHRAALAIAIAWVPLSSGHAAATCSPTLVDLGTLGGAYSVATGMDERGRVIGYSANATGLEHAFITVKGAMFDLAEAMPPDLRLLPSRAGAINSAGQVAGTLLLNGSEVVARMWRFTRSPRKFEVSAPYVDDFTYAPCNVTGMSADGALVGLGDVPVGLPYYSDGFVVANPQDTVTRTGGTGIVAQWCTLYRPSISARGDVAWQGAGGGRPGVDGGFDGYSLRSGDAWSFAHAPLYTLNDTTLGYVSLTGFNDGRQAAATPHDVTYCGYRWGEWGHSRATVFDANTTTYRDLGPGLFGADGQSMAYAISADNRFVAGASVPAGSSCPFVGTATLFTKADAAGPARPIAVAPAGTTTNSRALAVTLKGQVLGYAQTVPGVVSPRRPFVYTKPTGGRFIDALFPKLRQVENDVFQNERGQIAGTAKIGGQRHAFRIDCPAGQ